MLKFKFLLWALTKLLQRAVKKNPACANHIQGKTLVFQIQTADGLGRHFRIANGKVVECWTTLDGATLIQQMGLVPASGPTA
jgi:hypothetical protein